MRIDARSRLSNRPAYQPVSPGQRLRVTMTRCRNRLFADRIAFVGATVTPAPYVLQHGAPAAEPVPWGSWRSAWSGSRSPRWRWSTASCADAAQ